MRERKEVISFPGEESTGSPHCSAWDWASCLSWGKEKGQERALASEWGPGFTPQLCHQFLADLGTPPLPPLGHCLLSDNDLKLKTSFAILPSFLTLQVGVSLCGLPSMGGPDRGREKNWVRMLFPGKV